jgi:ABC-type polysaccharide/polyol phosphate transport system ATPase subunit
MKVKKRIAISLKNVSKTFFIRETQINTIRELLGKIISRNNTKKEVKALQDISLKVKEGEILGIIGRNGSGKSTLLNIMMEILVPDKGGKVKTKGTMMRLAMGIGVDVNLSARDNIYVNGSVIGLSFKKIGKIFNDIISFAGLEEFVDTPVKFYSKGMRQRLLFSISMHAEADIFLLDEFFGGTGDQEFRKKSDIAFKEKILNGKTIIIVSHSMDTIQKYCSRVIWLEKGKIVKKGKPEDVVEAYKSSLTLK